MELNGDDNGVNDREREEQEEALVALIEHRTREVKNFRQRLAYYQSQLVDAEKRLQDSESKLARLRGQKNAVSSESQRNAVSSSGQKNAVSYGSQKNAVSSEIQKNAVSSSGQKNAVPSESQKNAVSSESQKNAVSLGSRVEEVTKTVKVERRSISPIDRNEGSSGNQHKPELRIPDLPQKIYKPSPWSKKPSTSSSAEASNVKSGKSHRLSSEQQNIENKDKGTKRKFVQKQHKEVIPFLRQNSSPSLVNCQTSNHISSQHKRKLRSLALCPVNDQLFVTSALDSMVNLWQVQAKGSAASLLSATDCMSPQRKWPEALAWHPEGNSIFSVYSADSGDAQVSVTNLNKGRGGERVKFLEDKPHFKGLINGIEFMPWEDTCFVTGGSDHAVILWSEQDGDNNWKSKTLHRSLHSSAVMGVAGMQQKQIVLSAGADKRIFGYDVRVGRADFRHQIDSKCMSVLPNPCDFNLFMVQTGTHEKQLRLFDIRLRQTELHAFGWKQESSDSQSALINQAWSPDGFYIASGSVDPVIHIFDIRYNAHRPSQSIRAHSKRVFKATWLQSIPLLISISSDLNIGLHKVYY